jgi:hypothetical protein
MIHLQTKTTCSSFFFFLTYEQNNCDGETSCIWETTSPRYGPPLHSKPTDCSIVRQKTGPPNEQPAHEKEPGLFFRFASHSRKEKKRERLASREVHVSPTGLGRWKSVYAILQHSRVITTRHVHVVQCKHMLTAKTKGSDRGMEIVDHCPLQRRLDVAVNRVVGKGGFPRLPSNCTASEHLFIIQALSPS